MTTVLRLLPLGNAPRPVQVQCKTVREDDWDGPFPKIVLGSNEQTGIQDKFLPEAVVELTLIADFGMVQGKLLRSDQTVYLNKRRLSTNKSNNIRQSFSLQTGDCLQLISFPMEYTYQVEVSTITSPASSSALAAVASSVKQEAEKRASTATASNKRKRLADSPVSVSSGGGSPSSSPLPPLPHSAPTLSSSASFASSAPSVGSTELKRTVQRASSSSLDSTRAGRITEDVTCSVCLDVMVHPRTLYPCGHSFCGGCISSVDECPTCRQSIHGHAPARTLESLIDTLTTVEVSGCSIIPDDDRLHYQERIQKTPRPKEPPVPPPLSPNHRRRLLRHHQRTSTTTSTTTTTTRSRQRGSAATASAAGAAATATSFSTREAAYQARTEMLSRLAQMQSSANLLSSRTATAAAAASRATTAASASRATGSAAIAASAATTATGTAGSPGDVVLLPFAHRAGTTTVAHDPVAASARRKRRRAARAAAAAAATGDTTGGASADDAICID